MLSIGVAFFVAVSNDAEIFRGDANWAAGYGSGEGK
jgi:hypothetical protein